MWGRIDYNKQNEATFKVVHPELEYDKRNISEEVINYKTFLEWKFNLKSAEEVSNEEERKKINEEIL